MSISGLLILIVFLHTVHSENWEEIEEVVCQNEIAELDCPEGHTIAIKTAFYGKKDDGICKEARKGNVPSCEASTTLPTLLRKCNQTQSCRVNATNDIFGDPCEGYLKYLSVTYTCWRNYNFSVILKKIRCEHEIAAIECPQGENIKIVNALFGRKNQITCGGINRQENNKCAASKAIDIMQEKCDRVNKCSVMAEGYVFGDPCPLTFKYLEVDYLCMK